MTSFQSGTADFDPDTDAYSFDGLSRRGVLRFIVARALIEKIAGRAANPLFPEDLFDEIEPILFQAAERAYHARGKEDRIIMLVPEDLD